MGRAWALLRWKVVDGLAFRGGLYIGCKDCRTTHLSERPLTGSRHLHDGLIQVARKNGVELLVNAKVNKIGYESGGEAHVADETGRNWTFDLVIGSDGINSVVRKAFLPDVKPRPPTNNAAFRAIVPMSKVAKDPLTKHLTHKSQMDLWMGSNPSKGKEHGYVISYPISAGKDFNMVL